MAGGSEASPEIHNENYDMEESFMEQSISLLFHPMVTVVVQKNIRKVILNQRLNLKNVKFVGVVFLLDCLPF